MIEHFLFVVKKACTKFFGKVWRYLNSPYVILWSGCVLIVINIAFVVKKACTKFFGKVWRYLNSPYVVLWSGCVLIVINIAGNLVIRNNSSFSIDFLLSTGVSQLFLPLSRAVKGFNYFGYLSYMLATGVALLATIAVLFVFFIESFRNLKERAVIKILVKKYVETWISLVYAIGLLVIWVIASYVLSVLHGESRTFSVLDFTFISLFAVMVIVSSISFFVRTLRIAIAKNLEKRINQLFRNHLYE